MTYTFGRQTISDIRECCAVLLLIGSAAALVQLSPALSNGSHVIIQTAIVAPPAVVAICCIAMVCVYRGSRVFGRSFLLLGLAYSAVFAGEALYFFHLDPLSVQGMGVIIAEVLFLTSYPLFASHVAVNMRYIVGPIGRWVLLPVALSAAVVTGYTAMVGLTASDLYLNAAFVAISSALLGYTAVAFVMFRKTALSSPWTLLLIGITLGTIGDIMYRYAYSVGQYDFGDPSTGLWATSYMVVVYALYRHYRSM